MTALCHREEKGGATHVVEQQSVSLIPSIISILDAMAHVLGILGGYSFHRLLPFQLSSFTKYVVIILIFVPLHVCSLIYCHKSESNHLNIFLI